MDTILAIVIGLLLASVILLVIHWRVKVLQKRQWAWETAQWPRPEKEKEEEDLENLVCVLCGEPWEPPIKNRCECGGFCTWGKAKGAVPDSWVQTENGGLVPRPVPEEVRKESLNG